MAMRSDIYLPPGTRVRRDDVEGSAEFGVVIHCWLSEEICAHDCYVAFFGDALPEGRPNEKPYVLRYASVSLTVVD